MTDDPAQPHDRRDPRPRKFRAPGNSAPGSPDSAAGGPDAVGSYTPHGSTHGSDTPGHEGDTGPGSRSMPTHVGDDADTHGGAGDAVDAGGRS